MQYFVITMQSVVQCSVTVSRRAFVVAPGEARLRKSLIAMGLPYQKGFSYQVVVCKKQSWDRFLTTSFGFLAEDCMMPHVNTNKFIIGEINTNTAAERYFSVGDALIDFRGASVKPQKDPKSLRQFNLVFHQGVDMEVLIERPVSKDARNLTEQFIKKHLLRHDTPPMNDDAVNIGINAALYHHMFWRRMASVGILVRPPPVSAAPAPSKKKGKRKKKAGKTRRARKSMKTKEDATAIEGTLGDEDGAGMRITLEHKKSFQEISTDVPEGTDLESVGYRYSSDGDEDEDEKDDEEETTEKKKSPAAKSPAPKKAAAAAAAAPNVVVVPLVKKNDSKKSKRGLFSVLPSVFMRK
ncbi:hypothetical protein PFISCL1PPCAC_4575, partial [Pristionchus fissidentatus]